MANVQGNRKRKKVSTKSYSIIESDRLVNLWVCDSPLVDELAVLVCTWEEKEGEGSRQKRFDRSGRPVGNELVITPSYTSELYQQKLRTHCPSISFFYSLPSHLPSTHLVGSNALMSTDARRDPKLKMVEAKTANSTRVHRSARERWGRKYTWEDGEGWDEMITI